MQRMEIPICFFCEGSVVDVEYPYEDHSQSKIRPAVIVEVSANRITIVMLKISSVNKYDDSAKYPYAVKIQDISSAGLAKDSWVLTDKELIVNGNNKLYLKGHLSDIDLETVKLLHKAAQINNCIVRLNYD